MQRRHIFTGISGGILLFGLLAIGIYRCAKSAIPAFYPIAHQQEVLIIDAGHGGADGGAVSSAGTVECTINLAIAKKLDTLCGLYGVPDRMTRMDENSIHDASAETLREQKRSDLQNRVSLINETEHGCLISIHQNISTGSRSKGTQVFYGDTESQPWAVATQALFAAAIDDQNQRQAAKISDSVYLMSHIQCPAILVECGFLSNQAEDALLQTSEYQTKLAAVLLTSFLTRT